MEGLGACLTGWGGSGWPTWVRSPRAHMGPPNVHLGAVAVKSGAASSTSVVPREGPILVLHHKVLGERRAWIQLSRAGESRKKKKKKD
jgi:hypothetical protein